MPTKKTVSKEANNDTTQRMMAKGFSALGDPKRLKIVGLLTAKSYSAGALLSLLGGSSANLSKHLSILKAAGLITASREGANSVYKKTDSFAEEMIERVLQQARDQQAARVLAIG